MAKTYKLLEVKELNTSFKIDAGKVLAVNGVSLNLEEGKVLGIVGESGSGKSVTAYSIMGILDKNGKVDSGKIIYKGTDLCKISEKERREIRGNKISIIFQDAMTSLNPVWTIGNQLREAILIHAKDPVKEATYSLENEIRSDKQRIVLIEKGIRHHPDKQDLKDDLEFVKEKLVKDTENYEKAKKEAIETLKKGEAEKNKEFHDNAPKYRKVIHEKEKELCKNFFKRNPAPSLEECEKQSKISECLSKINDSKELFEKENKTCEEIKTKLADINKQLKETDREDPKYADLYQLKNGYSSDLRNVKKLIRKHKEDIRKARRKYKEEKFKFKYGVVHADRIRIFKELKAARKDLYNFKWECKSFYRETKYSANKKALKMLVEVGITEPEKRLKQYPFELSGGMLQRCMIAMALVQKPDILIADEPTTALDVTIQAQILDLLKKLQVEYGMAIIIITHDLGVVAQICDEVDVMYAGRIVERGTVRDIFYNPQHEYTKGLLKSMPKLDQGKEPLVPISGNPVDLFCLPKGCAFSSRCSKCMEICMERYPEEIQCDETGHAASCWAMIKRLHDEKKIDIFEGTPEGTPLVYNGAIIANEQKKSKKGKSKPDPEVKESNSDDMKEDK